MKIRRSYMFKIFEAYSYMSQSFGEPYDMHRCRLERAIFDASIDESEIALLLHMQTNFVTTTTLCETISKIVCTMDGGFDWSWYMNAMTCKFLSSLTGYEKSALERICTWDNDNTTCNVELEDALHGYGDALIDSFKRVMVM